MDKQEVEKAAKRLGIEEKNTLRRVIKTGGIIAVVFCIFLFILAIFAFLIDRGDFNNYPHVRVPRLPKNRFLAKIVLIAEETQIEYGVFSRSQLLS